MQVIRLLQKTVNNKIVEFKIKDPYIIILKLEEAFNSNFGLKNIIIIPTPSNENDLLEVLDWYAANLLMNFLKENLVPGIGWGRALNRMVPYLTPTNFSNIHVVSLTGGLAENPEYPNPYDVASAMAKSTDAAPHYLLFPANLESEKSQEFVLPGRSYQAIMTWWDQIDIALMSIGVPTPESDLFYAFPEPQKEVDNAIKRGAKGDFLANLFNEKGQFLNFEYTRRMVHIDFKNLRKVPNIIGIVGGKAKAPFTVL